MNIIGNIFKGMIVLSFFAVIQNGCSIKNIAQKAAQAHRKGLSSYKSYSRALVGPADNWLKPIKK